MINHTSISLIDKLVGCLCRDGSTAGRTTAIVPSNMVPALQPVLKLLGSHVVPSKNLPGKVMYDLGSQSVFHALYLTRAYLEVLIDQIPKFITFPLKDQLEPLFIMSSWEIGNFIKNAKFFTVSLMARFLKNIPPSKPPAFLCKPYLFTGYIGRILKNRLNSFTKKNLRLFLSILQGVKRGASTVPESFVFESLEKHRATLTKTEDRPQWSYQATIEPCIKRFFKKFRDITPSLFEGSNSSSYGTVRSGGGQREFLRQFYNFIDDNSLEKDPDDLLTMNLISPGRVEEIRGTETWRSVSELLGDIKRIQELTPDILSPKVKVSPVREPLKVRLITKGNPFSYYFSRFYQKALWGYLQRWPQFTPTGRPLILGDFLDLLHRERKILPSPIFDEWVSGDYAAATDGLKIYYTKLAFETSLNHQSLQDSEKDLLRSVLYEQILEYPSMIINGVKKTIEPGQQQTGQLMGSTLSFPILCIINLCCYWAALEEYLGKQVSLQDLPVLINGDDILFRCNKEFYSLWQDYITEVGFQLSLGKNYTHKSFFTINSIGYYHRVINGKDDICEIPYLNVGLLTGQSKLNKRQEDLKPLDQNYNIVLSGALNKLRAHQRFLHYNKTSIGDLTKKGNFSLFLSPCLGGCGFELFPEVKPVVYFTAFQRKLANFLYHKLISDEFTTEFNINQQLSYRVPITNSHNNTKKALSKRHFMVYRFIPLYQPLMADQRLVREMPSYSGINFGRFNPEKVGLEVKSFPIKTLLDFREALRDKTRHFGFYIPKDGLFSTLRLKPIEVIKEASPLLMEGPVDMDYYID